MEFGGITRIIVIMLIIKVIGAIFKGKAGNKNENKGRIKTNNIPKWQEKTTANMGSSRSVNQAKKNQGQRPLQQSKFSQGKSSSLNMGTKKSLLSGDTKPNGGMSPMDRMARREKELERKNR